MERNKRIDLVVKGYISYMQVGDTGLVVKGLKDRLLVKAMVRQAMVKHYVGIEENISVIVN